MYSFPIWNQSIVSCLVLTLDSFLTYIFLKRQVRWSGSPISFKNFQQFAVIHILKGFWPGQWSRNIFFFWNSLAFSMIQWMLEIWTLIPLPFTSPAGTSSSLLAWRIFIIIWQCVRWVGSFKPIKKLKEQWPSPRFMCQQAAKFTPPFLFFLQGA